MATRKNNQPLLGLESETPESAVDTEKWPKVTIYTDGGCDPNPGTGGWGAVLMSGAHCRELSGGDPQTTNNRMELTAAIEALAALKRPCDVILHTDSQYVQKGITEWMPNWKRKNWLRGTQPVKNEDLWKKLDSLAAKHRIAWRWVKGHAGDTYNERCDELATAAILKIRSGAHRP